MKSALLRYRVMANIVGVLLIVLVLVGLPLHYGYLVFPEAMPKGGQAWQWGADISRYLGVAHGWLYMIFLIMAFWLSRKARWDLGFTIVTLICGTVPILSFWAEHRATARTKAQMAAESTVDGRAVPADGGSSDGGQAVDGSGSAATKERSRLAGPTSQRSPGA